MNEKMGTHTIHLVSIEFCGARCPPADRTRKESEWGKESVRVPERSAMENGEPVENERLLINIRTTYEEGGSSGSEGERVSRGGYSGQQEELGLHRGCRKKLFNGDMAMKWLFISTPS